VIFPGCVDRVTVPQRRRSRASYATCTSIGTVKPVVHALLRPRATNRRVPPPSGGGRVIRTRGESLEALLGNRRPRDVTAQPLELSPVAAVDDLSSVHVDAAHLGDRVIGEGPVSVPRGGGSGDKTSLSVWASLLGRRSPRCPAPPQRNKRRARARRA